MQLFERPLAGSAEELGDAGYLMPVCSFVAPKSTLYFDLAIYRTCSLARS
jgi:hypothetical protein